MGTLKQRLLVIMGALLFFSLASMSLQAEPLTPDYTIRGIKIYLYLNGKDAFKDISNASKGDLWNTIIGEGLAGSPSNSTLVVVEVTGDRHTYQPHRYVELDVKELGKKTVTKLHKREPVGGLGPEGKYFAAFWVYETGCLQLKVTANLVGQHTDHRTTKRVEFECGE